MAVPTDVNSPLTTPSHTAEHQRVSDAVAALTTPTWIAIPFSNGWGNYGAGYELGAYCKIGNFTYLTGLVLSGTAITVCTFPVGYRPARNHLGVLMTGSGAIRWDISPAGVFTMSGSAPTAGSIFLSLTGLSWPLTALP